MLFFTVTAFCTGTSALVAVRFMAGLSSPLVASLQAGGFSPAGPVLIDE